MDWLSRFAPMRNLQQIAPTAGAVAGAESRKSVLLARWCAYSASVLWAFLVLLQSDVTRLSQYASLMHGQEDVWAVCLGSLGLYMMVRMWRRRPPALRGLIVHVLLTTFWLYVLLAIYFTSAFIYPTAGSTVPVIVVLHLYGFVGSHRWVNGPFAR